jgi:SAM-dependent methyltransferase
MTPPPSTFTDAVGYELLMGRWSASLAREFVRYIDIEDSGRILDVGCGTGSLAAAALDGGRSIEVVGIDPSPAFVDLARDRIHDTRAHFQTGDAQRLEFPDHSFDCTAALLVLNFVTDRARAAAEMRRVTRPGGKVAACVWDYDGEMTMLHRFWDAATALDPGAAGRHEGRMPLCHLGELGALWHDAGLERIREGPLTIQMSFASFEDYWSPFLSGAGPSGGYAAALPPERRDALRARLLAELWENRPEEARTLRARSWAVLGLAPGGP